MIKALQGIPTVGMSRTSCSPPDENGAVRSLTAPAVPGPGVCTLVDSSRIQWVEVPIVTPSRLSNLDLNGKLVKRGLLVSWHGFRGEVVRVRRGYCVVRFPRSANPYPDKRVQCESVQVVL